MKRTLCAALAALMLALCACGAAASSPPPAAAPARACNALAAASGKALPDGVPTVKHPLAAGFQDYYAIRQDGTLIAWGRPEFGGFQEDVPFEKAVELLPNAAAVYTNFRGASLAVDNDGVLWGINTSAFNDTIPGVDWDWERDGMKPFKLMDNVAMAAINQFSAVILKRDGTLWVNGTGSFGAPWLHKTGSYLVQIMDNVIWADIHYAVTADHELWGWHMSGQDDQPPRKLADLDEGVVQVSWARLALTEKGNVYHWDVDDKTGAIERLQMKFSNNNITWCGGQLAIMKDGSLWRYAEDYIPGRPGSEHPEEKGDFYYIFPDAAYAAQGETDILVIKRDGSLWQLSPKEGETGSYTETRLGTGFHASAGANVGLVNFSAAASYRDGLFSDVKPGDWFQPNVKAAFELQLMNGNPDGTFAPKNTITVAEAVTIAARVRDIYYGKTAAFTAKSGQAWYQPYVDYAQEHDILTKDLAWEYARPATRAQLAWLLWAALDGEPMAVLNPDLKFSDVDDSGTVNAAILGLSRAGVMQGKGNGIFDPNGSVLRSEAAAMLSRAVQPALRVKVDATQSQPANPSTAADKPPLDEFSRNAAVPDFLDEEQQALYRQALNVYNHLFGGDTGEVCNWEEGDTYPWTMADVEYNGIGYTKATGRYAAWADFDALVHSVFTDSFWDSRNAIQRGERFIDIDGATHFIWASRGMYYYNDNFPDTFKLISKTSDEITFTLTGHYSSPWPNEGETSADRDARWESGWDYTIDFPIRMVRTADGWRFDKFHSAIADQEDPDTAALLRQG